MHLKRSAVVAVMVVGIGAMGTHAAGAAESHAAPAATHFSGAADNHVANIEAKKLKGAIFDHVIVDPLNPGLIIPCIKVLRHYYQKARHHPELVLRILVTYKSNGVEKQKLVVVELRDMDLSDHDPQPSKKKWNLVQTAIEVTSPMDPGTGSGTATLFDNGSVVTTVNF